MDDPKALSNRDIPLPRRCRLGVILGIEEEWLKDAGRRPSADELRRSIERWRADAILHGLKYAEEAPREG